MSGMDAGREDETPRPRCHMTPMEFEHGEDIGRTVYFWECRHCGHTKEIGSDWREGC